MTHLVERLAASHCSGSIEDTGTELKLALSGVFWPPVRQFPQVVPFAWNDGQAGGLSLLCRRLTQTAHILLRTPPIRAQAPEARSAFV